MAGAARRLGLLLAPRVPAAAGAGSDIRTPPVVTVIGGPHRRVLPAPAEHAGLAAAALLAVASLVVLLTPSPPPPKTAALTGPTPAPAPLAASLRVVDDRIEAGAGGVLVVPVEVDNPGPAATLALTAYAEPVRADPTAAGPSGVPAAAQRGLVVLVAPDCRLLRSGSGLAFVATVAVHLRAPGGRRGDVSLDLAARPAVAAAVAGVCAGHG